jgi:hypothetical protein
VENYFWLLVTLAAIGAAIWWASKHRSVFVVRLTEGRPRAAQGRVTSNFLAEVADVCRRHGIASGTIRGLVRNGRIALSFSGNFPAECQQQLRNIWAVQGWSVVHNRSRH